MGTSVFVLSFFLALDAKNVLQEHSLRQVEGFVTEVIILLIRVIVWSVFLVIDWWFVVYTMSTF